MLPILLCAQSECTGVQDISYLHQCIRSGVFVKIVTCSRPSRYLSLGISFAFLPSNLSVVTNYSSLLLIITCPQNCDCLRLNSQINLQLSSFFFFLKDGFISFYVCPWYHSQPQNHCYQKFLSLSVYYPCFICIQLYRFYFVFNSFSHFN